VPLALLGVGVGKTLDEPLSESKRAARSMLQDYMDWLYFLQQPPDHLLLQHAMVQACVKSLFTNECISYCAAACPACQAKLSGVQDSLQAELHALEQVGRMDECSVRPLAQCRHPLVLMHPWCPAAIVFNT